MWNNLQMYFANWYHPLILLGMMTTGLTANESADETATVRYREDARLVERARVGDQGAFRQLFERYAPLIYRIAFRMLGQPEDAADLTQDVFVRAYERLSSVNMDRRSRPGLLASQ
jgi:hypothetical protein